MIVPRRAAADPEGMRHHDLIERMLPPTAAILCAVLAALAVWAATAGAAAAGRPAAAANAFSGPIEAPPRAIERVLGPESRAGLRRVACVGEPAAVASCYVATR